MAAASFIRVISLLAAALISNHAHADAPGQVELHYKTQTSQANIGLNGNSKLRWINEQPHSQEAHYRLESETTTPLLGTLFRSSSRGKLSGDILFPLEFSEVRLQRNPKQLRFQSDRKFASWADNPRAIALKTAAQDRLSMIWQLVLMMKTQPPSGQDHQTWQINVVSNRSCDTWRFQLVDRLRMRTSIGEFDVLHLARINSGNPNRGGNKLEFWLAPSLEYYPVQILFEDTHGLKVEQKISSIQKH